MDKKYDKKSNRALYLKIMKAYHTETARVENIADHGTNRPSRRKKEKGGIKKEKRKRKEGRIKREEKKVKIGEKMLKLS